MNGEKIRFVCWQDQNDWLGYIEDYPDYVTQGNSFDDLKQHLKDLYKDLTSGEVPNVRRIAELELD